MADAKLVVVLGPTASGKSALSETLAVRTGADILSVDSMQVYRGMDIGTAKPTAAEQARVKYHLIDLVEPDTAFTVARFVELADGVIRNSVVQQKPVIATGGTPLYYKALFEGLFDGPPADPAVRERLAQSPVETLYTRLKEVDPEATGHIHTNDSRRIIRALEVYELTGRPISSFQTAWKSPARRHTAVWFGLNWDRDVLNRRINARVKAMIAAGWVEETRQLLNRCGRLSQTAGEATGYAELIRYLQGQQSLDDAVEQIRIATRQLARKQMKWFRRFPNVHWLAGDRDVNENADIIVSALEKTSVE